MITGNQIRRIKCYLLIDRCGENIGVTKPRKEIGEDIWGVPYGFHTADSAPFIEHHVNGKTSCTVNAADVSWIEFED